MYAVHVIASGKDIYVLADLALFIEDVVAKCRMMIVKGSEGIAYSREFSGQTEFHFATSIGFQMTAEVNGDCQWI